MVVLHALHDTVGCASRKSFWIAVFCFTPYTMTAFAKNDAITLRQCKLLVRLLHVCKCYGELCVFKDNTRWLRRYCGRSLAAVGKEGCTLKHLARYCYDYTLGST